MSCQLGCIAKVRDAAARGLKSSDHVWKAVDHGHSKSEINEALHAGMSSRSPSLPVRKSAMTTSVSKAAHRRDESLATATYGHRAQINQHARNGRVREAGSTTKISIGNQRTWGGNGAGVRAMDRGMTQGVKVIKPRRGRIGAAAAVGGAGAALAHHKRSISKSAFGIEGIEKGLGVLTQKTTLVPSMSLAGIAGAGIGARHREKKKIAQAVAQAQASPASNAAVSKASSVREAARRPTTQNTRKENTKVGAAVGGGLYGGAGAAFGAAHGRAATRVDRGAAKLGVGMSRSRAAGLTAGKMVNHGGKAGAVAGGVGLAYGAAIGASAAAKKKRKTVSKSAFGVDL